jgi:hypothetical protein
MFEPRRLINFATLFLLILGAALLYVFCRQEILEAIAAPHDYGPEPKDDWFTFFLWAVGVVPLAWAVGALLVWVELQRKRRLWCLAVYLVVPFILAATYWFAWEKYLKSIADSAWS